MFLLALSGNTNENQTGNPQNTTTVRIDPTSQHHLTVTFSWFFCWFVFDLILWLYNTCVLKRISHKKKSHFHPTTRIPNSSSCHRMVGQRYSIGVKDMKNAVLRPLTIRWNVFWVSKIHISMLKMVQNFHICLWWGPMGLPPPPLTVSLTLKRPFLRLPYCAIPSKWASKLPLINDRMVIRDQIIITNNLTWEPQKNIQSFPLWPELSGMKGFEALGSH